MIGKKAVLVALVLTVLGGTAVYAGFGCNGGEGMFGANPDKEKVRLFLKETGSLRDEMMLMRLELNQELAKATPDKERLEILKKEFVEKRNNLQNMAKSVGLTGGCITDCNLDPVECAQTNCEKRNSLKMGKGMTRGGCGNCNK